MATDRKPGNTTDDRAVTPGRQGFASIHRDDQQEDEEETGGGVSMRSVSRDDEAAATSNRGVVAPVEGESDELERSETAFGAGATQVRDGLAAREVDEPAAQEVPTDQGASVDDGETVSLMGRADDYGQGPADRLSPPEYGPSGDTSGHASRIEILPEEADQQREQQAIERDDADGSDEEDDRRDQISFMSRSDDYGQGLLDAARDPAEAAMDPPPLGVAGASIEDQLEVLEDDQETADLPIQE